jgi:fatty-acyl-CoA synthase
MFTEFGNKAVHHVLEEPVKINPHGEALVFGETRDTYLQFQNKVNGFAAGLQRHGIEKGDRVAINLPTCAENIYAFFALFKIGASFVPLNPDMRSFEVEYILRDCSAKGVITIGEMRGFDYLSMFDQLKANLPEFETVFVWGSDSSDGAVPLSDLLKTDPESLNPVPVYPDDIACILYTSGTTGLPKGTVHTHKIMLNKYAIWLADADKDVVDTRLLQMPLFNAAGVGLTVESILKGDKLVLTQRFMPTEVLSIIQNEKVNKINVAPTMIQLMLSVKDFDQYDLSTLREVMTGGSMASPDLVQSIKDRLGCNYINTYAMTEAGIISRLTADDPIEYQLSTVGRAALGVELKILDDDRNELPLNQSGEIAVRSPGLMSGYFNDEAKTKDAFDEDGFYFTGDIGSLDENGYLRILDRKKDVIIRGAQNIYPSEVEKYLTTHPKIQMSALIGVPSPISGEKVRAYVQLVEGEQMTDVEVVDYCRGKIAGYKIPEEVHFVEEFPLNKMGKIQKKILREEALNE